ncbi:MAG: beta-lactamase family protein [Rhodospirillales bacterium]|nr:beta-lactamase family protein [Rhodospirillales bacterium]
MADDLLPKTSLREAGLREEPIAALERLIERHIADRIYPGASFAIAREGRLVRHAVFGDAAQGRKATAETLWLLYSNTKVVTAAALWVLAEEGLFRFTDPLAKHVPEFARHGKGEITVLQLMTHRAGFPSALLPPSCWEDHAAMREAVCNLTLEWTPGSRLHYHGTSAHWAAAVLLEALTGQDFREVIRERVLRPLGLEKAIHVGLPSKLHARAADMHEPSDNGPRPIADVNAAAWRLAGVPGAGGYATAVGMAAFYQALLGGGALGKKRFAGPRTLAYAIRDWTGEMVDGAMGMPMHRGIGPHLRGTAPTIRGLGSFATPATFGHGGVGSSYCWGDPVSGVSFAYLTNCRVPDPWHSERLDVVSNLVHAAVL